MPLSEAELSRLEPADFVFPDSRRHPIPTRELALEAEVKSRGTNDRIAVIAAVKRRYNIITPESL